MYMARYYFDVTDDKGSFRDADGIQFPTIERAKQEAARALAEIARDRVPGPDRLVFIVLVRDERKEPLFGVRLTIEVLRLAGAPLN
jgi:hypothetical protein